MKIKQDLLNQIIEAFEKLKIANPNITPATYKANKIGKDTDMRFRWDAYYLARGKFNAPPVDIFYKMGLHDTHIDTALKAAVKKVWG